LTDEKHALEQEKAMNASKLEDTQTDVRRAQEFLRTSDSVSGAEVISMLGKLNSAVLDVAANVTDHFSQLLPRKKGSISRGEKLQSAQSNVETLLVHHSNSNGTGSMMRQILDRLVATDHREDPFLLQTLLQASLCACIELIVTSWALAGSSMETLLNQVYESLLKSGKFIVALLIHFQSAKSYSITEKPIVATRWRALTRKHLGTPPESAMQDFALAAVTDVLLSAGIMQTDDSPVDKVRQRFGDSIGAIVRQAIQVRVAVGQEVQSTDLTPFYVPPGTVLEPFSMDHGKLPPRLGKDQTIVFTTDLGLSRSQAGQDGGWQMDVLLKARVLLPSELEDAMA
jgi:hypothetical protein